MADRLKGWKPTNRIIRGVVVKPYLPLRKHPELKDQHTHILNLYAGDEVFVFEESKDGKWLRCYLRWIPLPESHISGTLAIDDQLLHLRNKLVVVPRKFVCLNLERIMVEMPFLRMPNASDLAPEASDVCKTPSVFEVLASEDGSMSDTARAPKKPLKPSFPYFRYQDRPLADELSAMLVLLSSWIYGVYSSGDFNLFEQLVVCFYDLKAIRMKLHFKLYTSPEVVKISRAASALLANISKLISSKDKSGLGFLASNSMSSDPTGVEGIFARDINTGQLLSYEGNSLQGLVSNTMLHGLSKNFPVSNYGSLQTDCSTDNIFEATESHILVDVNDVKSDASVGDPMLQNLSASMYLCSRRGVLTEPFTVNMDSDQITSLNSISAALFRNIPASRIERGNIYLAVVLTEKIPFVVDNKSAEQRSNGSSPFILLDAKNDEKISFIRRGVAAGAVDITKVFAKYNESNADLSEAFKIKINLFGSFMSREESTQGKVETDSRQHESKGWGDLIDRILLNSHKGIAVNPRTTTLMVTVKEIKSRTINKAAEAAIGAIRSVPTHFYDILSESSERIYLSLGKVMLSSNLQTNIQAITIQVTSDRGQIKFNRIADEDLQKSWEFVTVRPGESIGEIIRINGLKYMRKDEFITLSAFLNGLLMARTTVHIRKGNVFLSYKKFTTFQLLNAIGEPLLDLELSTQYVGKKYNVDVAIERFKSISSAIFDGGTDPNACFMDILSSMSKVNSDELQKHFRDLFWTYLRCMGKIELEGANEFTDEVRRQLFVSFVDFIDKVIVRSDQQRRSFKVLYEDYLGSHEELPNVGPVILQHMAAVIRSSNREWNVIGSAVCRTSLYLLMVSLMSSKVSAGDWKLSFQSFFSEICQFVATSSELVANDQTAILQTYDAWLDIMSKAYEPEMLVQFSLGLLQSCRSKEGSMELSTKELCAMEAKYLGTKLSLLRRIILHRDLYHYLFGDDKSKTVRFVFLSKSIDWALLTYTYNHMNLSAARLANGVLISIIENARDRKLSRNLLRLLPTLCKAFLLTRRYCKDNNLFEPKITFTRLFPFRIANSILPMDSLIQSEVVVEVLLELVTIISDLAKLGEKTYGTDISFVTIFSECSGDIDFRTEFCARQISNNHITALYHIVKIITKGEFFPAQKWLGVSAMLDRSMTTLLSMCKDYMIQENLPQDYRNMNIRLWSGYFKAIFALSNRKRGFLVNLGIIARKGVFQITGNLKARSSELLASTWEAIANQVYDHDSEVNFGVGAVSPAQQLLLRDNSALLQELFLFSMHRHLDAVKVSTRILWCCAVTMWKEEHSMQSWLDIGIPQLYDAYQSGRLYITDNDLQRFKLCALYTVHTPPSVYGPMVSTMENIFAFLHTACEAFKISNEEEFDNDKTAVHLEMSTYLLKANRPELFHQMIYDLYIHFLRRRDNVQAGLCLELLANTYEWNMDDFLPSLSSPPLPEQCSFARKEYLYKEAAKQFSTGLKFERALCIYRDLIEVYDLINYDLAGLAYAYGEMANIYNELQTVDRLIPTYFKVSFSGLGFPTSIRNKSFIFEGLPFEHITSIHERLLRLYHGTTIVRSQREMDEHFANPPMGKYIHVVGVEPQFDLSDHYKKSVDSKHFLNSKVWIYIKNRELRTFSNSVKLPGSTSVTDLWVEEVTYTTASTFPTLMNRSEVVEVVTRRLSPFQTAIRSLRVKIQEFNGLENMCWKVIKGRDNSPDAFNELSRNLAGTIDSPVNGGFAKYRAFSTQDLQPPISKDDVESLQVAFSDLAIVLARCLILHQELLPSKDLEQSHNMLIDLFKKNFEPEISKNKINLHRITASSIKKPASSQRSSSLYLTRAQMIQNLLDSVCKSEGSQTESISKEITRSNTATDFTFASTNRNDSGLLRTDSAISSLTYTTDTTEPATFRAPVKWSLIGLDNKDNL
ncbi:hypothetical protein HG536_0C05570 [Torulaspora globosa]|uniref:DOCKER domain-containing protein n=1 Tax=Torulaspora globosa TaxID=48254 RepID=A0A7G3ZFV2_9SACH|nr:uncharacterized protein HG536_0C05570 [Torulaspora globosa]QLL32388.1 hypothetical protein HG536_0C05570 [Torulaspora globosa]